MSPPAALYPCNQPIAQSNKLQPSPSGPSPPPPHRVSIHLSLTEWVVAAAHCVLQAPQHVDEVTGTDHTNNAATLAVIQRGGRNALRQQQTKQRTKQRLSSMNPWAGHPIVFRWLNGGGKDLRLVSAMRLSGCPSVQHHTDSSSTVPIPACAAQNCARLRQSGALPYPALFC